jgi:parvulin-like peptidyl-prolyl isomerase
MRLWTTAALILAGSVAAQTTPPRQPDPVGIDQVVATVGDAAILRSTLTDVAAGRIRVLELDLGRPLREAELAAERNRALEQLIDQHCLAQAAKTLGVYPPSLIEERFQEQLYRAEQEQVRQLGGSYQRWSQELRQQGKTWQTFEREQRLEVMGELTKQIAIYDRLQNQRNLFITPRMMRDFYRENREQLYVHGPRVTLGVVAFLAGTDPDASTEQARAAAGLWRQEGLSSAELAARCPGARAPGDETGIGQDSKQALKPFMRDFALGQPAGTVSEPIREGGAIWLLKVLERQEGRNDPFEDAAVQADIRRRLEAQVVEVLLFQAIQRSRARTHVWRHR